MKGRLEAQNQILEMLLQSQEQKKEGSHGSLLPSAQLQFLAGCFGLSLLSTHDLPLSPATQLRFHYQVSSTSPLIESS